MISDYTVLRDEEPQELERQVKMLISQGWEPLGGVSLAMMYEPGTDYGTYVYYYAQAMILNNNAK